MQIPTTKQLMESTDYTRAHIDRIMKGQNDPSIPCARKLASAIGISVGTFIDYLESLKQPLSPVRLWPLESE